jgi:hypothetical protein
VRLAACDVKAGAAVGESVGAFAHRSLADVKAACDAFSRVGECAHFSSPLVRLTGLVHRPELNGSAGQIVGPLNAAGRWPVELDEARPGTDVAPAARLALSPSTRASRCR